MKRVLWTSLVLILLAFFCSSVTAVAPPKGKKKSKKDEDPSAAATFSGLKFRSLGPAITSGRIGDFAVRADKPSEYFVAVSSGNVWKTVNAGTTYEPIFDGEGSYSIGCVTLDPTNPLFVWVGSGENNSQRSVAYGDGVYKSVDGGKNWQNVGLEESEHIGEILIDPRDSDVVWVAAQGPLWRSGGDRGLYKTTDGGQKWELSLEISKNTGVSDIAFDPRNPDVLYASAYQRRRHVWTLIDGGPESAIYKTSDGGQTWSKLTKGLPKGDVGRIGLAVAPSAPDIVYAIIEAASDEGGFYRSQDAGANWKKMSDYVSGSPQYYQEIFVDPQNPHWVYSMDTFLRVTEDGGKTFERMKIDHKHVDDHAMWIDPNNTDHLLVGCDGGIYETWDRGANWHFKNNLPLSQFYKITVDNDSPFYNVYGGTQDNNTIGGPSRTTTGHGIVNSDWFITLGGDGFEPQVDPQDPNIVYCQSQHGGLARYDRNSGERTDIQPQPGINDPPQRWNWSSALMISPHSHTRLYFCSQQVWHSDDRGNSWTAISGDLTRQLDRNKLEIMDTVWSVDAVAKNRSTSFYGTLVSLSESPLVEGLIYTGSDDGLIHVTENNGLDWQKKDKFGNVPEMSYVSCLTASLHDPNTVYATFDNHKQGDFNPYVLKSTNRGGSWKSITGDLPDRGHAHAIVEDHIDPDLLFVGTEFGVFFTQDGGEKWTQLKAGIPVIACRDLEIQQRENDLVVGTFGRGFYILDDYSPLRHATPDVLENETILFPVKNAWMYIQSQPYGGREKGTQGASFFTAPNPPFGAVITYYLPEELKTLKKERQEREQELREEGRPVFYPDWEELRLEDREEKPAIILTITDTEGQVVRRLTGPTGKGFHRVAWNLRHPSLQPTILGGWKRNTPWDREPIGPLVTPGGYTVSLARSVRGDVIQLGKSQSFEVVPLGLTTLPALDHEEALAFQQQVADLQRAVLGASEVADEAQSRINHIKQALLDTPGSEQTLLDEARNLDLRLKDLLILLEGDRTVASRSEPVSPSIRGRIGRITRGWTSTSMPTGTQRESYAVATSQFGELLPQLKQLIDVDLVILEQKLETLGAPWTPGRVPVWGDR